MLADGSRIVGMAISASYLFTLYGMFLDIKRTPCFRIQNIGRIGSFDKSSILFNKLFRTINIRLGGQAEKAESCKQNISKFTHFLKPLQGIKFIFIKFSLVLTNILTIYIHVNNAPSNMANLMPQ